ncbi:MAG: divalent-cation tolerance protein CutA [Pirellulales bacterium]
MDDKRLKTPDGTDQAVAAAQHCIWQPGAALSSMSPRAGTSIAATARPVFGSGAGPPAAPGTRAMPDYIQVVSTTARKEQARAIADELLQRRLAACVQIGGPIESSYWWQGNIETSEEWQLIIKSRADLYPELEQAVLALHPYDVPELLVTRVETGHAAYLEWMAGELSMPG